MAKFELCLVLRSSQCSDLIIVFKTVYVILSNLNYVTKAEPGPWADEVTETVTVSVTVVVVALVVVTVAVTVAVAVAVEVVVVVVMSRVIKYQTLVLH